MIAIDMVFYAWSFCVVQDTDDSQASMEIIANVAKLPENKYCADCGAMGMCGCA